MKWDPNDFKRDDDNNSNTGDATVALLRNLTGSMSASVELETKTLRENFTSDFTLSQVLVELKIMNRHLAEIRNEVITGEDVE